LIALRAQDGDGVGEVIDDLDLKQLTRLRVPAAGSGFPLLVMVTVWSLRSG
jgi:hypothetical protein